MTSLKRGRLGVLAVLLGIVAPGAAAISPAGSLVASATTWTITLSASATTVPVNSDASLTATANHSLSICGTTTCYIDIFEVGQSDDYGPCYAPDSSCSAFAFESQPGSHTFRAFVDTDPNIENPPTGILAASNSVTVTWILPSQSCDGAPNTTVINGPVAGDQVKLVVKQSGSQDLICFRIDNNAGLFEGGALVVSQPPLNLPSVRPGTGACSANNNHIPGPHPLIGTPVLGVPVYLDTWSDLNTSAAVCLQVGSVAETVIVPVGGLGSVTLTRDPGSIF